MSVRHVAIAIACLLSTACRPVGTSRAPRGGADAQSDGANAQLPRPAPATEEPEPAAPCAEGGEVWDGHHQGCRYEVAGCCYPTPAAACSAARCADHCRIMEVAPAQIVCEPAESPPVS